MIFSDFKLSTILKATRMILLTENPNLLQPDLLKVSDIMYYISSRKRMKE